MDLYEVLKMMYTRVQALDPENVSKIVGYLLLQDESEHEMFRLAFSSEALLISVISRTKQELGLSTEAASPHTYHHLRSSFVNSSFPVFQNRPSSHQYQQPFLSAGVFPNDQFYPESFAFLNRCRVSQQHHKVEEYDLSSEHGSPNSSSSSSNSGSSPAWKPCVYYSRGHCKHGSSCRFLHSPTPVYHEPSSLERLEHEICDILRPRKSPVLVSSLQQLYYEEYGRPLHVDDGEESSGLRSLLWHSKKVHLVDQPNGQKAIGFNVEDGSRTAVPPYSSDNANSARQIYMTFPAESTFTEEDVNVHFSAYGPVHDVRIPYQQKRMFGFVTFFRPESVKTILAEGNPHFIRGARVLVKPYRDKVKHTELKADDQTRCLENGASRGETLLAPRFLGKSECFQLPKPGESKYSTQPQTGSYLAATVGRLTVPQPQSNGISLHHTNSFNAKDKCPSYTNQESY